MNQTDNIQRLSCCQLRLLATLLLVLLGHSWALGDNWPRFRGPNADGVVKDDAQLPEVWDKSKNVQWVADVPGLGWSCPVVWDNKVFLTTVVSEEENIRPSKGLYLGEGVRDPAKGIHHWLVYCFELQSGKELWKHEAHTGRPKVPRHPKSSYAAETATTDGERLYVLFGDVGLYCYDLNGKQLWSQAIEPKKTAQDYGAAASPVVHDGQVFVVYDNLEASWIAAFDAKSGEQRWRQRREETHSWATPLVWQNELRTEIVVPGQKRNRSYSLDGKLLWEFDGNMSSLVIPSPFAAHGLCYIASGYVGDFHRPTFAVRPGASGNITPQGNGEFADSPFIEWYQGRSSPYNTSQIVYGDYLYTLYDQGFMTCHEAKTGLQVYSKRRFSPGGTFTSSPWAYNGYLFCLSEDGLTYVVKAGPEFKIVARNNLDELCLATPAVVDGKLLLRTASKLYCIAGGERASESADAKQADAMPAIDIWSAAREGNRKALLENLESGVSVNAKDAQGGATPLNTAALYGQTDIAKLLIDKGADVSIASRDGNTALHLASFFAHEDIVKLLLENGASVEAKNRRGETPLNGVSADWSPDLERIYKLVGNMVDIELDLDRIKQARPRIADLLRDRAEQPKRQDPEKAVEREDDESTEPGTQTTPNQKASTENVLEDVPTGRILKRTYEFKEAGEDMEYALFVPTSYDGTRDYPLIVALHGLYSNPNQILNYPGFTNRAEKHGYLLVAPMGYNSRGWYGSRGKGGGRGADPENLGELSEQDVMNVLELVRREFVIDEQRIFLFGHSMGGGGSMHLAIKYPHVWAATAQVAPALWRRTSDLEKAKHIPTIIVQGDNDRLVPAERTRRWINKMVELEMKHRYIEVKDGDHIKVAFTHFDEIFEFYAAHPRPQ